MGARRDGDASRLPSGPPAAHNPTQSAAHESNHDHESSRSRAGTGPDAGWLLSTRVEVPMRSPDPTFVDHLAGLVLPPSLTAPPSTSDGSGSLVGSFLSNPSAWLAHAAGWAWRMIQTWWPLLAVVAVAALAASALLAVMARRAQAKAAERASWVEITPPAVLPAEGAHGLWRALAGLLFRTRRYGLAPRRLAVEFVAGSGGMRVGVWVCGCLRRCRPGRWPR